MIINDNNKDIYCYNELSLTELLNKFYSEIKKCNDISSEALNFLIWLKNQGLSEEVEKQITEMYENGELEEIINEVVFAEINNNLNKHLRKDICLYSSLFTNETDNNIRLEKAIEYTSINNLILFIDEDIELSREVELLSNCHILSNTKKYKIFTNVGSVGNGNNLLVAYEKENIIIDNVKFENTGHGSSGSNGIQGRFDYFGAGVCFGGCSNITVKNCEFFKCGGYGYGEGCASLWFSCCHYVLAENNYVYVADNGIICDRWFATSEENSNTFNFGIIFTNNRIETISGRGIGIENINGVGLFNVTNNIITDYGVAGVEGRTFNDCIISNNLIDGGITHRVNPFLKYEGLDGNGFNWSEHLSKKAQYCIQLVSGGDRQIISNNILQNVRTHCISLGAFTSALIEGNRISGSNNSGIYALTSEVGANSLIINGNNIRECTEGLILRGTSDAKIYRLNLTGNNILTTSNCLYNEHTNIIVSSNNIFISRTGSENVYFNYSTNIMLNDFIVCEGTLDGETKTNVGLNLNNVDSIQFNCTVSNFGNGVRGRNVTNLYGSGLVKNTTNAINFDNTVQGNCDNLNFFNNEKIKANGCKVRIILKNDDLPLAGTGYYSVGDIVLYNNPAEKGYVFAICSVGGANPTWKQMLSMS